MMTMTIMVGLVLNFIHVYIFNNKITEMKDTYNLSESEVYSFFDDDGGDVTLSSIHGKVFFTVVTIMYNYYHCLLY